MSPTLSGKETVSCLLELECLTTRRKTLQAGNICNSVLQFSSDYDLLREKREAYQSLLLGILDL